MMQLKFLIKKIGVVGRTGAGKSSLVASLFHMADISGEIQIDNISTSKVDLVYLRSKMSVIPQVEINLTVIYLSIGMFILLHI